MFTYTENDTESRKNTPNVCLEYKAHKNKHQTTVSNLHTFSQKNILFANKTHFPNIHIFTITDGKPKNGGG